MDSKEYIVGIDLGTSNITMSYGSIKTKTVTVMDIGQLSSDSHIHKQKTLPAYVFLPSDQNDIKATKNLPWLSDGQDSQNLVIGSWAQKISLEKADQVISSAKSWLCHKHISAKESHLPWGRESGPKISAFLAMHSFLEHLKLIFKWELKKEYNKDLDLANFDVVVTVPASFDEDARSLIYEATQKAGLKKLTLLEEPQAALYSWIAKHETDWRNNISKGELILVCDVGGGTTDFSLVCVGEENGQLKLERISVGKHLLLGGDNMDHALAYFLMKKLEEKGPKLDRWQFISLVGQVKEAKESIFNSNELKKVSISVASKGSSLFAKTRTVELAREDLEKVLVEGFFPKSEIEDHPKLANIIALQDIGLEYESETAITKHLAQFLCKSAKNISSSKKLQERLKANDFSVERALDLNFIRPDSILFNGGVFKAEILRKRVLSSLENWGVSEIRELPGFELDLAVSKGASYYGKTRKTGKGIRIQAGTARSYYLGVESSGITIPGIAPKVKGLCVIPQGTEEGTKLKSPQKQFGLMTGNEVQFRFFSSSERAGDEVGNEVEDAPDSLEELPAMKLKLKSENDNSELVPVVLDSYVNDIGLLELSMKNIANEKKWKLEFNVRNAEG